MKILCLMSGYQHAHDYGLDFLLYGLREQLGAENVFDWPEKPCLHIPKGEDRDDCQIDSDAWWEPRGIDDPSMEDFAKIADLVLIMIPKDDIGSLQKANKVCTVDVPEGTPIAAIDMTDHLEDYGGVYQAVVGKPLAGYFKRELPLGATFGIPCPLSYPANRTIDVDKFPRVFYHATHHDDGSPGIPRKRIVAEMNIFVPAGQRDIALYPSQRDRPTPEEYHDRMARSLVGVSWNGAPNWDCNRFWENFAFGLCQVAEQPRTEVPNEPKHLRHCWYVQDASHIPAAVRTLLSQPVWSLSIAAAGHAHFLEHHSSEKRAAYVLKELEGRV